MLIGVTKSGFPYQIDDNVLDDYELLEIAKKIDDGDLTVLPNFVKNVLGKEQEAKLKDHLRKENGRISTTAMLSEVMEIMSSNKESKNS